MAFYYGLKREPKEVQRRAAEGIMRLRQALAEEGVPRRTIEETLLLATWNIREFDSEKYGARTTESFYYIAEIVSHFDLVAVQEVREDLRALDRLQSILGGWWKYIVTDVTEGTAGNRERMAFLYDSRKVVFGGLAGEIVLPDTKQERVLQFARTPFICGFKAGWTKFNLCTVHIYYGKSTASDPRRVKEIRDLAKFLAKRAKMRTSQPERPDGGVTAAVRNPEPENLILLGDFNIFSPADETMQALVAEGFTIPDELKSVPGSNVKGNRHYDQIAFMARPNRFGTTGRAGVFNYYKSVFTEAEEDIYRSLMGTAKRYGDWRTHQMSDHLVMWVELRIDFAREYLAEMAADQ
jgi:endonuclease/exonuclease/phosphatase family metal-dependent hydrolase